jgi:hypothetical protein
MVPNPLGLPARARDYTDNGLPGMNLPHDNEPRLAYDGAPAW